MTTATHPTQATMIVLTTVDIQIVGPRLRAVRKVAAMTWLLRVEGEELVRELARASAYAAKEGYTVHTFPAGDPDGSFAEATAAAMRAARG